MAQWIDYIWQSTFCLLFFYGIYWLFLKNQKAFGLSRVFLLITPLLAMALPLLEIPVTFYKPSISLENNEFFKSLTQTNPEEDILATYGLPEFTVKSTKLPLLMEWKDYLIIGYLSILLILFGRFLWHLLQLRMLKEKGWYQTRFDLEGQYFFIPTFGLTPVFSYFNKLFWDDSLKLSKAEKHQIISHEQGHIQKGHTWDLMYYQALSILFWFNPAIHLMRSALMDIHEYSADQFALDEFSDKSSYSRLVAKMALDNAGIPLSHQFSKPSILKRLTMIKKTERTNWVKVLGIFPLSVLLLALVSLKTTDKRPLLSYPFHQPISVIKNQIIAAQDSLKLPTKVQKIKNPVHYEFVSILNQERVIAQIGNLRYEFREIKNPQEYKKVLKIIEVFKKQSLPTSEPTAGNNHESLPQPKIGAHAWNDFLKQNLRIPLQANNLDELSTVEVEFMVDRKGIAHQPRILKSGGWGMDEEVLRLFTLAHFPKWKPSQNNLEEKSRRISMPINFNLYAQ